MKLLADERSIPNHRVGLDFLTQQYVNILVMLLVGDFNGRSPLVLFRVKKTVYVIVQIPAYVIELNQLLLTIRKNPLFPIF